MLSPVDMMVIGAAALVLFGPDQLPKVAKRAGQVVREVQNTSQSFIREMERAADDVERREHAAAPQRPAEPIVADHVEPRAPGVDQPFGDPLGAEGHHAPAEPVHKEQQYEI